MNKLTLFTVLLPAALLCQACKSGDKNDSVAKADSINEAKKLSAMFGYAVEKSDAEFAVNAASGGLTELELGALARNRAADRRIKNFGAMMTINHAKINARLTALAASKNISLPVVPGAKEMKVIGKLSKKSGADFDKAYISSMIADHKNDIRAFELIIKRTDDPDIKSFAAKTLPMLQAHLDAINAIKESMK